MLAQSGTPSVCPLIQKCLDTQIAFLPERKSLKERYEMPVLVVETGCDNSKPLESNLFLSSFLQQLIEAGGDGLFYWEPELTDDYNLSAWTPLNRKVSIALDAFNGHQLE